MKLMTVPNILSASRLAAAPALAAVFWLPLWTSAPQNVADIAATALFLLAAATDFADGYWARRHRQQSRFGAFLDPVADKILVVTALLLLVDAGRAPVVASLLIVAREVVVSALREWAALAGAERAVRVSAAGKWKTATQMIAVPCLFAGDLLAFASVVGATMLWAAALLALWAMTAHCLALRKSRE